MPCRLIHFIHACPALLLLISHPGRTAEQPQTADLLLEAPYRRAYVVMQRFPDWISRGQATSTPVARVVTGGHSYLLGHLCKPHDCDNNQLDIVFAADGHAAWGLLHTRRDERQPFLQSWLGNPNEEMQALLLQNHAAINPPAP
ncbi:inhibitor of lysozyme (Ivy) [Gluconacetobacter liquefaciens]|uniref:Inhibitor of lysozyme (Ivy) n=2 Tax=Gluconacetobacter liquefaciens TaxID=89584 RepID=A0A370FZT9_GLULI|nr:inhibitor of lysozyme (Ivy) [Gluconacetobacter liquefaciens]